MTERPAFGLYVHWPFCQAKCPYCDFNSHVAERIDDRRWRDAYVSEIERIGAETGPRILSSIFFGGGTPSLMQPDTVAAIIDAARRIWQPANDLEITLEANPTSVEASRFKGFRDAGVNRVSVGLQALNEADLRALGRLHTAAEGRAAFEIARNTFDRVSFDLIYARQNQGLADWKAELSDALSFAADHLSLYQLTIEPGTVFAARAAKGGLRGLPEEDLAADMFELTQDMTGAAGLPAYETSNHARPGAESRHNLIYWTYGDWAGVGPGAHGRLTLNGARIATEAPRAPGDWLARAEAGNGELPRQTLSANDAREEAVLMGLRLTAGIPSVLIPQVERKVFYINSLSEKELLEISDGRLRTTRAGRPLLNAILSELLT